MASRSYTFIPPRVVGVTPTLVVRRNWSARQKKRPQLMGRPSKSKKEALQAEGRRAGGYVQSGSGLGLQADGLDGQAAAQHALHLGRAQQALQRGHLQLRLYQGPVLVVGDILQLIYERHAFALDEAAQEHHRSAGRELEFVCHLLVRGDYAGLEQLHLYRVVVRPHVGDLLQAEYGLAHVHGAHEGALALGGGNQPSVEEYVYGTAHGDGADPVPGTQLWLGGQLVAGAVDAGGDLVREGVGNTQIGRLVRGRVLWVSGQRYGATWPANDPFLRLFCHGLGSLRYVLDKFNYINIEYKSPERNRSRGS